jgi:superfamily II DNA or RNA helicase
MVLERGKRVIFTAPAVSLIDQTVDKLWKIGIADVGVIQQNHPLTNYARPVQVCSVQTLARRKIPKADLCILDEVHIGYDFIYRWMADPEWANVPFVGLTATPWARAMGAPGRWDDLIVAETIEGLTNQGYLVPIRYLAPAEPDLGNIKITAGDYNEAQLAGRMRGKELLANTVDKWIELGEGRPTIAFCVDRAHARDVQQRFVDCGIGCGYIDGNTPPDERAAIGRQLERGEIKVITSVGCLIVGLDLTFVSCILHSRPTKSFMLFIQSIGRGLRLHDGKSDCLVLDCANNWKLGHPYEIHFQKLDDGSPKSKEKRKEQEERIREAKKCPSCGNVRPFGVRVCPACGFEPTAQTEVIEHDGDLVEVGKGGKVKGKRRAAHEWAQSDKQDFYSSLLTIRDDRGYKDGWAANQYKDKFGSYPEKDGLSDIRAQAPSPQVLSYVRHRMIRWAKSKKKEAVA